MSTQKDQSDPMNPSTDMEVMSPSVVQSIERAQIDSQISTAKQYPRSLEQFKKRALEMACLDVETAESCIYYRPVGRDRDGKQTFAEGASIRLAEIVSCCYGNIMVASRIVEQTDRYVKCEGVCRDLEYNVAGRSEAYEPTVKRDGTPYGEAQRAVVAKACLSKAYRDAIFRVVPKALCKSVYDAAKKVAAGDLKSIDQRVARVREWLKAIKVEDERVFAALNIKGWSEVGLRQLELLTGLKTAIGEGDTKPEEAFPALTKQASSGSTTPTTTATVTPTVDPKLLENPTQTILDWMKRDSVSDAQVIAFCKKRDLCGKSVTEVPQMSDGNLRKLVEAWSNVIVEIKQQKV